MKKVIFEAQVKKIEHISLVSGDKMTRVTVQFASDTKLDEINALNALHAGDKTVAVAIAEIGQKR